jgi:hypothetical protein
MERRNPVLEKSSSRLEILGRNFIDAGGYVYLCEVQRFIYATKQPDATESPIVAVLNHNLNLTLFPD